MYFVFIYFSWCILVASLNFSNASNAMGSKGNEWIMILMTEDIIASVRDFVTKLDLKTSDKPLHYM